MALTAGRLAARRRRTSFSASTAQNAAVETTRTVSKSTTPRDSVAKACWAGPPVDDAELQRQSSENG